MTVTIEATSDRSDVVWEPSGGLFTGCVAARRLERRAFGGEVDHTYFHYGVQRLMGDAQSPKLILNDYRGVANRSVTP